MTKIKEKTFFVLEVDKKNKNFRVYSRLIVDKWRQSEKLKTEGFDIEYAVGENIDLKYEFVKDDLVVGVVTELYFEGNKLYAKARFKLNCINYDKIYNDSKFLDGCALVPKGKGAVKNQNIQEDYELYGFNLIKIEESSFIIDETELEKVKA